ELARPDLPWLFTPAAPNNDRLRPWLVLVVVLASNARLQQGRPLPRVSVPVSELPDLDESWAWAHAQVTVDDSDPAAALETPVGGAGISRLLCPRKLSADRGYLACIVPATLPGCEAGLGLKPSGPEIAPAWDVREDQDVTLPVYYSWTFTTG